ncbi:uncharacterized protein LOC142334763 isoform X2 [Convolutriloba macropyga]
MLMLFLSVLGSMFNICVLVVYGGKRNKCTFEVFVFFLAGINLSGSMLAMPVETVFVWASSPEDCNSPPDSLTIVTMVLECASILSLLNIAVDRYFSICWPTRTFITESRAKILCGIVSLIALMLGVIPLFLSDKLLEVHLIYSVSAALVLLTITLLYIMVFLKVRSTASRFKKNRFQAAQRSLTEKRSKKDSQMSAVYTVPVTLQNSGNSHSMLTVESIQFSERRASGEPPRTHSISISQFSEHLATPNTTTVQSKSSDCLSSSVEHNNEPGCSKTMQEVTVITATSSASDVAPMLPQPTSEAQPTVRGDSLPAVNESTKMRRLRMQPTRSASEKGLHDAMQNRTAKILTAITFCYALCFLPTSVINFLFYVSPDVLLSIPTSATQLIKYVQLLYILNFVISPTVYSLFSESFRKDGAALTAKLKRRLTL